MLFWPLGLCQFKFLISSWLSAYQVLFNSVGCLVPCLLYSINEIYWYLPLSPLSLALSVVGGIRATRIQVVFAAPWPISRSVPKIWKYGQFFEVCSWWFKKGYFRNFQNSPFLTWYTLPSRVVPCTVVPFYRSPVLRIRIWEDPKLMAWSGSEINISDLDSDPDSKKISKTELYIQAKIR
jgi:hypothetical protein